MTEFEFLAIGISLILGLGTTLLLTSFLTVFVNRQHVRVDWIPLAWALYILLIQIQYYAATWNLNSVTDWTFITFALPLFLAGLIFLSAGLVLPIGQGVYPSDLGVYFEKNGKWAVAALALRGIVAILANYFVMAKEHSFSIVDALILSQIIFATLFVISKKRKLQVAYTLLYGLVFFMTLTIVTYAQLYLTGD